MLIRDYTKSEIDRFVDNCNFTDNELRYFLLKSKDKSNVQISFEMNVSTQQVSKIANRVKAKMKRV